MIDVTKIHRKTPPKIYEIEGQKFADIVYQPIDLEHYMSIRLSSRNSQDICKTALYEAAVNGALMIVNPPITDKLEDHINGCTATMYDEGGLEVKPEFGAQVGMQKKGMEQRRPHLYFEGKFQAGHGLLPEPKGGDEKDRMMIKYNPPRYEAALEHPGLNQPGKLPPKFTRFSGDYEEWNYGVGKIADIISEIYSRALGLPPDYLRDLMRLAYGPTLLAPTQLWVDILLDFLFKVKIGSHADQAAWTYHGKSPEALCLVSPDGYRSMHRLGPRQRLVQGGLIGKSMFGFEACLHQVMVTPTLWKLAQENGGRYRRISCTSFIHGDTMHDAGPVPTTRTPQRVEQLPSMPAGRIQYWNLKHTGLRITPVSDREKEYDQNEPPENWALR